MLTKAVAPRTKAELIAALSKASFRSVEVYEGDRLAVMPTHDRLKRDAQTVIILYR